jgi:predicted metalloprotease with PDZ domain
MKTFVHLMALILLFIPYQKAHAEHHNSDSLIDDNGMPRQANINIDDDIDTIAYTVTIDKSNHKFARVSMTFSPKNDTLYMAQGANQLPNRWATFVHNLEVIGVKGNDISVEELSDAQWKLQSSLHEQITVNYEVRLDHEEHSWSGGIDGAAYATDWGVFYTGRSLFILNGDEWKNITIDFIMPSNWHITTPFEAAKNTKDSFVVNNQTALRESMIFAGTHEEISFKRDDFELIFALGGAEIIAQKEEFKNLAEGVLDYYIELMGGIPNPPRDNKFKKSIVIINTSTLTDGEVIGNNISMVIDKNGGQMSTMISRFLFAHEFFHLWNGKSFWPSSDETEWFKEGFTNYYTLKALHHIGFLDDSSYLDILNSFFYQRYNADSGIGKMSMTNGAEKHNHWGLIYGGGLFVAISQDMIIRKVSNNKKSVDDLMKGLFQKYGGTNAGYSLDELRESLSELSGKDQSEFFNSYVNGAVRIPIDTYLSMASLEAKIEDGALKIAKKKSTNQLEEYMTMGLLGIIDQN